MYGMMLMPARAKIGAAAFQAVRGCRSVLLSIAVDLVVSRQPPFLILIRAVMGSPTLGAHHELQNPKVLTGVEPALLRLKQ